ncbi:thioredoxin reductase [Rhizobium anhuiense]|uniref:cytochrome b/b6 domain-containing protein n=1 Tax=Rhizobium anhuiense TaxID=1184720 RepID=UPI000BE99DFE|nr:cytochrome b/b6 domain-containing protein [Rhizobium anhuiense]PDS59923.1 thioredoxin reductase [Rhizobium anhuiense]
MPSDKSATTPLSHPLIVRLTHWINAVAMVCMAMSGMGIYNAHPIFAFRFPEAVILGGWLGGSTIWHFAVMWLFVGNSLFYVLAGIADGYLHHRMLPIRAVEIVRDMRLALAFHLPHDTVKYNAVQKALYVLVLLLGALMVASGLAIWKPVQFSSLTWLLGGFEFARVVHFIGMISIFGFLVIHLAMVAVVPRTLISMTLGSRLLRSKKSSHE